MQHIGTMSDPIESAIFEKLAKADPKGVGGKSIEPADVAKELQPEQWQRMLPKVRHSALALMRQGKLTITKKGKPVDPNAFKGVIRLRLPSLRERREDIPLLAQHFLRKSAKDLNVDVKRLSNSVIKYLITMDFPGNVRQLENLCHWLTVMAPSAQIEIEDLPPEIRSEAAVPVDQDWIGALEREAGARLARGETRIMDELTHQFEKALILKALAQTGGRRIEAATLLGIGRNTLTRKVQELGIDNKDKGSD